MKNKKANITITILVLGVLAVCILALISFISSKAHTEESFGGIKLIEKMNSQIEDYSVYKDLSRVNTKTNEQGTLVFYQEKIETSGYFFWKEQKIVFSVESPVQ